MYAAGIRKGAPKFSYRVVLLNLGNLDSFLWIRSGDQTFSAVGVVPDQIGELKAGDYVEYRNTLTFESLVNFSQTGEGNIVTKVLCRKAQPDFEACLDSLTMTGKQKDSGDTGRPFPASVKDYGFTFTPAYDKDGSLLKSLPPACGPAGVDDAINHG
jgi:hypothetical protein